MDLNRLNWKLFGLLLVFLILYGITYGISFRAERSEDEEREVLVNAIESAVDRVYESAACHASELALDSTIRQVLMGQVKPEEVTIDSNGGSGLFTLWGKGGELLLKEGADWGLLPSPYPLNERILLTGDRGDSRPCLVVGSVWPVKNKEAAIGTVGFYIPLNAQEFSLGERPFEVESSSGELIHRSGRGVEGAPGLLTYVLTDGAGLPVAVIKAAANGPSPAGRVRQILGRLSAGTLLFLLVGLIIQFLLGLLPFRRGE